MFITKNINLTCRTIHLCLHQICKTNILFIMKNCRWSGYNLHFYNIGGKKVTSISFFYCYSLDKKKSMNYLTPVGISVRSVVTIRSSVPVVTAIVSIPWIGFGFGFGGSGRSSFSFPLLSTPVSVSVSVVSVVGSVSVVTAIVSIPGIGFGISFGYSGRFSFSFPLLSAPVSVSVCAISVVGSVSVVTTIVSIPGISLGISFGYSVSFSLA